MKALLDTGPWVALLDRSETAHEACKEWFQRFSGQLYTTEPVLTEVTYLLSFSMPAQHAAIDFVLKGAVTLVPSDVQALMAMRSLMEKYADLPMDFADASLVYLAEETGILHVVTLDRRDFSVYRTTQNHPFKVSP